MFEIKTDLSSLNRAQREAFASFVLNFPYLTLTDGDEDDETVSIPPFSVQPDVPSNDRLDKAGIPWDERIHASSRAKTADDLWRKRRGIDDATVAQVEGELKALMAIPQPPAAPTGIAVVPPPPAVPVDVVAAAAPPAPPVDDKAAFVALITLASNAIGAKKLTQEQLTATVVAAGVPNLPLLGNRLDLVPQVRQALETIIACAG